MVQTLLQKRIEEEQGSVSMPCDVTQRTVPESKVIYKLPFCVSREMGTDSDDKTQRDA
jgi:hypothetical protein